MTNEEEEFKGNPRARKILDRGYIVLTDWMGSDDTVAQSARVSYGEGTKTVNDNRNLIRYLLRHKHTTPFEMVEFRFLMKLPIFVARQMVRHRTASINEYSGRYSIMTNDFYVPEADKLQPQSTDNKQGRNGEFTKDEADTIREQLYNHNEDSYEFYYQLTENFKVARELSRTVLPVSNYTKWYWKSDLHNIFRFIMLRADPHAQYEIRQYAEAMYDLIKEIVPISCEAFNDYIQNGSTVSSMEIDTLKKLIDPTKLDAVLEGSKLSIREKAEFKKKFNL